MPVLSFDKSFEKQPAEQITIRAELANIASSLIVSGYTLNAADVKVFDSTGTDVTATLVSGTRTIDAINNYVFVTIMAGTDGNNYIARFRTTWTKTAQPDQIIECDLLIQVRQKGF